MRTFLATVALVTAGLTAPAMAETVTIDFSTAGYYGDDADTLAALGGGGVIGSVTYDNASPYNYNPYLDDPYTPGAEAVYHATLSITLDGVTYMTAEGGGTVYASYNDTNVDWADKGNTMTISSAAFYDENGNPAALFDGFAIFVGGVRSTAWDGLIPTADQLNAATSTAIFFDGQDFARADGVTYAYRAPAAVPLPAGGLLLMTGLAGLGLLRRRRQAQA